MGSRSGGLDLSLATLLGLGDLSLAFGTSFDGDASAVVEGADASVPAVSSTPFVAPFLPRLKRRSMLDDRSRAVFFPDLSTKMQIYPAGIKMAPLNFQAHVFCFCFCFC
jgi:hypothetical protein